MVQSKKFRGVRQRQWGSWVSEIRHPLLKKRIWLGTFDTAEAAAKAYDEAAVLMSGQNAKTNFPIKTDKAEDHYSSPTITSSTLSEVLGAKLRKSCKDPAPSVTCLRLDNDGSNLGVWQKRAGRQSGSQWVMKVDLINKNSTQNTVSNESLSPSASSSSLSTAGINDPEVGDDLYLMDEENRVAMQMVEELLDWNATSFSNNYETIN